MTTSILRLHAVQSRYSKSRSSTYADIAAGLFVPPISLGARAVGWPSNEVDEIISARIAGATETEIRTLVAKLIAARKAAA
jgi:prophage regulatory protein